MSTTGSDPATGAIPGAGAMPPQPGTNPAATTSAMPSAPQSGTQSPQPAIGADDLGDAGKRAIEAERTARSAAERERDAARSELEQIRTASQSDAEKALNQAKREAAAEERVKWQAAIRRSEVRSALRAAGLASERTLELAPAAAEFSGLKVAEDGSVEGLAEAVKSFKEAAPELFATQAAPRPGGSWDASAGGSTGSQPATFEDAVTAEINRTHR